MRLGLRRAVTAALTITLGAAALAGCGGDGDDASTTTTLAFPTTTTVAVAPPDELDAGDQEVADASVLTTDDLRAGWKGTPWKTGDQPFFAQAKGDCAYLKKLDSTEGLSASALSEQLLSPQSTTAAMRIHVYPTEAEAAAVFATLTGDDAPECIASTVAVMRNEGGSSGSAAVEIGRAAVTVPGAVAFFGVAQAGALKLGVGYAMAQKGRAIVLVTTAGPGEQAPDFDAYLAPVMDRLSDLP